MILVYGLGDDPPIARLVRALQEADADFQLLDIAALDQAAVHTSVGPAGVSGELELNGSLLPFSGIRAVYARPLPPPSAEGGGPASAHAQDLHQQVVDWLDVASALVVSRPAAMLANGSKPLQAQLIGEAGFLVPATLVTSEAEEVRAFRRQHGRVVFKSISGVRSIVTELDDTWLSRTHRLAQLPTQFQAHVPGVDIRVHVVGGQTFAAQIASDATDYRYAHRSGKAAEVLATVLPADVAARCVAMSQAMDLPLSGIDLRLRPDGEYVCFEVNPMPAYSYFEAESGLPIAAALAQLLVQAN